MGNLTNIELFSEQIVYTGVWQKNDDGSVSGHWNYASAEFVTDSKTVLLNIDSSSDGAYIKIDDIQERYTVTDSKVELALDGKMHNVRICSRYDGFLTLKEIMVEKDAKFEKPQDRMYIQFIGDSISHFCSSFSFCTPEILGVDYAVVAQAGMSLHDGWGWYPMPEGMVVRRGMESLYTTLGRATETSKLENYDFKICRAPDVLVIFLGTNDYLDTVYDREHHHIDIFANAYCNFVGKLRERFPKAKVYMLQALSDKCCRVEGIDRAFEAVSSKYEDVTLIRTDEWGIEISDDGTHPSADGFRIMGEKLAVYLKESLNL